MVRKDPETSNHISPEDCLLASTIVFTDNHVKINETIRHLAECTVCGRKFERVWAHSHDQCYRPENQEVTLRWNK